MSSARRSVATLAAAIVVVAAFGVTNEVRADEVEDLSELLLEKPPDMDRDTWRQERREAARRLGRIGDPRAVPALIELVRTETFDVAAEHAIDALAEIGDDRAIPVLREAAEDSSRDRLIRAAARRALASLGADVQAPPASDEPPERDDDAGALLRDLDAEAAPAGPEFDPDVLAASERLTFAAGGARLEYDTIRSTPALDGDVSALYERIVEETRRGTLFRLSGDAAAGLIDFEDSGAASRTLVTGLSGTGEVRFYTGSGDTWFGLLRGDASAFVGGIQVRRPDSDDTTDLRWGADVHATLGAGYGRFFSVGSALRIARVELALERAGALGRPITGDVAERIQRAWWALRGEQGSHRHLESLIAVLREAGVLLEDPPPSLTYQLIRILEDGQLVGRPEGFEFRLGITESYVARASDIPADTGRAETLIARARYGAQSGQGTRELEGEAIARYRILSGDDPAPWLARGAVAYRNYFYNDVFDPLGALEFRGSAGLSDDDLTHIASRVSGGVGWIWFPNRASRYRLGGDVAVESGELFVGLSFEAVHGLLDVGYVGAGAWNAVGSGP